MIKRKKAKGQKQKPDESKITLKRKMSDDGVPFKKKKKKETVSLDGDKATGKFVVLKKSSISSLINKKDQVENINISNKKCANKKKKKISKPTVHENKDNLNGHVLESVKGKKMDKRNKIHKQNKKKLRGNTVTSCILSKNSINNVQMRNANASNDSEAILKKVKKINKLIQAKELIQNKKEIAPINSNQISNQTKSSIDLKKEKIKLLLARQNIQKTIESTGDNLRKRMLDRLKAAQFRYLNEKLYTSSGSEARNLFQEDPAAFHTYHEGYQQQLKKWPVKPLDIIVKTILKMPKSHLVADMGCGEGSLSTRIPQTVRSFDLVATAHHVEICDIAHTPLLASSVDVAVYCLALMGTELTQYLLEANRVLKQGGHLLVAEVESRFNNVDTFTREVERLGFKLKDINKSHNVFFFMHFVKTKEPPVKKNKLPVITLKPCLYKKR